MRRSLLVLATVLLLKPNLSAGSPGGPLRFIPKQADMVVVVEQPRRLSDALTTFEPFHQLAAFPAVKEQLAGTQFRQFLNLIRYYETSLRATWPELLDELAGGGVALGVRFDGNPPTTLLVVQSKDEVRLRRAFDLVRDVVTSEQERNDAIARPQTITYRGITGYQFGPNAYAAVAGPVLFLSNKREGARAGLDLYINGQTESLAATNSPAAAKAILPSDPIVWSWANFERLHQRSEAQAAYRYPKGDPGQVVLLQGMIDVIGKVPFVATGTYRTEDGFRTVIRMPAGRDATPEKLALHLPPANQPGSLPLLQPKNCLVSMSYYLDLGRMWAEREQLFTEQLRKGINDGEKNLGRFLAGRRLSDILTQVGPYHRFVIAAQTDTGYQRKPDQPQPAYGFVADMRQPGFAEAMSGVLRATALVVSLQAKLKLAEEKVGDVTLVTYRFPETADQPANRFNFSPCFARVGNQFVVASTVELGRELVGILKRPASSDPAKGSPQTTRVWFDSAGGAAFLHAIEDQILTQTILDRAVPVEQGRKEAKVFLDWLSELGTGGIDVTYGPSDFTYELYFNWRGTAKTKSEAGR